MSATMLPGAPAGGFDLVADSDLLGADFGEDNDVDPRSSLSNMSDAMLVLAVGLMMALVMSAGLTPSDLQVEDSLAQMDAPEEIADEIQNSENAYIQLDNIYEDPVTGNIYRVVPSDGSEGGSSE